MKEKLSIIQLIPFGSSEKVAAEGLSKKESIYWKDTLLRTIRIASEIELNLQEQCMDQCRIPYRTIMDGECWCTKGLTGECNPICINKSCERQDTVDCKPDDCLQFLIKCLECNDAYKACSVCKTDIEKINAARDRENITSKLRPKNNVVSAKGVYQVTTDGSLIGEHGVEITTIAQYPDYYGLYNEYKRILDVAKSYGAWVNERCSIHIHMLTQNIPEQGAPRKGQANNKVYYNGLEKAMPGEIGVNFHQLARRFEHVLEWMFSTGNSLGNLTRWEKFRQPILSIASPAVVGMSVVNNMLLNHCRNKVKKDKYSTFNYFYSQFTEASNFKVFHTEARFADGSISPSSIASLGCLLFAMLMKSIEISRHGILAVGTSDTLARINEMRTALVNNSADYNCYRVSNTGNITKYIDQFREESIEFIQFLEPYLRTMGNAYYVLMNLADRPISLRRAIDKLSWEEIEKEIDPDYTKTKTITKGITDEILVAIDLGHVFGVESKADWFVETANVIEINEEELKIGIETLLLNGVIKWSEQTKTYTRA